MSRRKPHHDGTPWQGFADMAMGLMAVLALLLVVMVAKLKGAVEQAQRNQEQAQKNQVQAQRDQEQAQIARKTAIAIAREALEAIQELVGSARLATERQQRVMTILARTFEEAEGCELRLDAKTGNLVPQGLTSAGSSDFFFKLNDTALTPKAADAVARCAAAWRTIGVCLAPAPALPSDFWETCRGVPSSTCRTDLAAWHDRARSYARTCMHLEGARRSESRTVDWAEIAEGIEALLLEGHTDSAGFKNGANPPTDVEGIRWDSAPALRSRDFLTNAHLGAERARSALAHVLATVAGDQNGGNCSVEEVLHSRLQVVSPSFGHFMSGPHETPGWREFDATQGTEACADAPQSGPLKGTCPQARTLRLRIRWKEEALRSPLRGLTSSICEQLQQKDSPLNRLIEQIGEQDPHAEAKIRTSAGCGDPGQATKPQTTK